jgi:hypothetical protein
MTVFETLNTLNVNEHTEIKKAGNVELTYLSWPWAWAEIKKKYEDAQYTIWKDEKGLPYSYDPQTGYMVYTSVTINGITHEMWLPVMDGANKAMKAEAYKYTTGFGQYQKEKTCEAASMFDINKTIMRCLVKNLAMFGLGLYIYAGEDLPEGEDEPKAKLDLVPADKPKEKPQQATEPAEITKEDKLPWDEDDFNVKNAMKAFCEKHGLTQEQFASMRKAMIDGGVVENIPSIRMGELEFAHLTRCMMGAFPDRFKVA